MEGTFWEKFGLFLIVLGLIIGAIGAVTAFAIAGWLIAFFYIGFLMAILGFAIAVLYRIGKSGNKKENK